MKTSGSILTCILFVGSALPASADQEATDYDESEVLFARRIAPLFREKCVACHGANSDEIEGGYDLRTLESSMAGGDSGDPGIAPGEPEQSSIYLAAARGEETFSAMPPKEAEKLDQQQLAWLRDWIKSGAKWPSKQRQLSILEKFADQWSAEDGVSIETSGGLSSEWTNRKYDPAGLWAYRPLREGEFFPEETADRNPIDILIHEALPEGLKVAPPASRRALLRRATFDLTGLPPTPDEVAAFLADQRDDAAAMGDVLDRLLDSPHYGERMAQHWLDVVRYADSSGFANDYERGNAWRYRDYVVRSFNNDKPYDQFVREQIAGDEIMPDDPEGVIAVGFLRMGPWELTGMEVERVARQRFLDDVTNSVGETFLGHSLQCARCHDHKFDPVPTRDYYRIQAVFATTQLTEREADFLDTENTSGFDEKRFFRRMQQAHAETRKRMEKVLEDNAETWFAEKLQQSQGAEKDKVAGHKQRWDDAIAKAKAENRRDPFNHVRNAFVADGIPQDEFPPKLVGFSPHQHGVYRVAGKGNERLKWTLDRYQPYAHSVYSGHTPKLVRVNAPLRMPGNPTRGELEATCIRTGGDPFAKGEPVEPGTLSVLDNFVSTEIPSGLGGRRAALADWIADADNPLTTRVIVNRIWQWHFGEAIAGNPNNFGSTGGRPTHPKLLDYLASTFVADGWSIKKMHRRIMMSQSYRRSSTHPEPDRVSELDPLGNSLAVFRPRRLTAEELRDSMLAVTGELNPTVGGIPCRPEINIEVAMQPRQVMGTFAEAWVPNPKPQQRHRRSIYVLRIRGVLHPMLEVFNWPAPDFSCERRETSTVTPQVFSLFNGESSYSRGLALADRAWREVADVPVDSRDAAALARCFQLALGRNPSADETTQILDHWQKLESALPAQARPSPPVMLSVTREAVEENTGERFSFEERLFANEEFEPDLQPVDVDRHIRALGDICLVIMNSNEFVYVY